MSFAVDPGSLHAAAGNIELLNDQLSREPLLGAEGAADKMPESAIATALYRTGPLSAQVRNVISQRLQAMSGLFTVSADTFHDTDRDAADRLAALGDINPGK
ncbi:hypothetical protein DFR76_11465 [Nocardia pseudobrasiliensis]|uniref:Excreted virulence factor EspC (Type VII ESX diderm) n=2 Tax=Nocardia pseudobrasiliensis TaxID=45979 RepID=A0A370HSR2_9NOCA|nr:hypothetical protein DFR76_11465 [Nocardia pseudobrasiliensis]